MMWRSILLSVCFAVLLSACSKPPRILILDRWWNVDYAKNACASAKRWMNENRQFINQLGCSSVTSCPEMSREYEACLLDEKGGVDAFQAKLETEFAASPACAGLEVLAFPGSSRAEEAITKPHWMLLLDFAPGSNEQGWTVVGPNSSFDGSGSPEKISRAVCAIVSGKGAAVTDRQ